MQISPQQWERIAEVFEAALALPPGERLGFVATAPGGAQIQEAVMRLLEEDAGAEEFLARPIGDIRSVLDAPEASRIGTVLASRYRVVAEIARGGAGIVYLARDEEQAGSAVVVKLLHEEARESRWLQRKFASEAEALRRLDHPGIVRILNHGETGQGEPFLVMEHVAGTTLRAEITGPMPLARVASIVRQTGAALAFAHTHGVVHRDLKPENVMLAGSTGAEIAKIIDFGIAQVRGGHTETETGVRLVAGTTRYMAPEQLLGEPAMASDIYALGIIAYEMLAGRCPYAGEGPVEILKQQGAARLHDLREIRPDVSTRAWRLIRQAISFRAEDRPAGALEFSDALSDALSRGVRFPGVSRRAALLAGCGAVAAAPLAWRWREEAQAQRVIQMNGARAAEGFAPMGITGEFRGEIIMDSGHTRWEAFHLETSRAGSQVAEHTRPLSAAQARLAMRKGWSLTLVLRLLSGLAYVVADFAPANRRYDINAILDPAGRPYALLTQQIVPEVQGISAPVEGSPLDYHEYRLAYDPRSGRAELWIDGARRAGGYAGLREFQSLHPRLCFGVGVFFGADKGAADFKSLRFQIG